MKARATLPAWACEEIDKAESSPPPPPPEPKPSGLICTNWRPLNRGSLRGFATIEIPTWHLEIRDIPVHVSEGKWWTSLPARPLLDADHKPIIDEKTGKIIYATVLRFTDIDARVRFSQAVPRAVETFAGEFIE
jgi:hypothetical protein